MAILYRDSTSWREALTAFECLFGGPALVSEPVPFTFTDYYRAEMGEGLMRRLLAASRLADPGLLAEWKITTNAFERDIALRMTQGSASDRQEPGMNESLPSAQACQPTPRRVVNLDVGYITGSGLILASTKAYAHRIYLSHGIYAELTLLYRRNRWEPQIFTYPDFRSGAYEAFLSEARERHLKGIKEIGADQGCTTDG